MLVMFLVKMFLLKVFLLTDLSCSYRASHSLEAVLDNLSYK